MTLKKDHIFSTPIYFDEKKDWVDKLNKSSDTYIEKTRDINKLNFVNNKDFGIVHHSCSLINDDNFKEFLFYINSNAFNILDNQGFNLTNYSLVTTELWVQEFASLGGGNHSPHTHWNGHISGFYFLKCSDKTSYPIFHDPRSGRIMNLLPEKNNSEMSLASSIVNIKPKPGTFIFFNSYLQHEFVVDHGIEPFRFIHFNIQAVLKQLVNNNIKRISS
jgi:uncharacterized protein (TIGR02466 family)